MRAIDVHCHPSTREREGGESSGAFLAALEALLGKKLPVKTVDEMANDFRRDDVLAMIIATNSRSNTGSPGISNDFVANLTKLHPDVFLPGWGGVDPWAGKAALAEIERAIKELGLTGFKWMPITQGFYPHHRKFYPIWDLMQSLGAPALIHCGTTAIGGGMEGGGGLKLDHARPMPAVDNVAADFPRLTIVMAHPAWPWTDEAIAVLLHKKNVYLDVSGWRPKYMPASLKYEMSRRLQDKLIYGSDYPGWSPGQYMDELEMEGLKSPVLEKVFYKNALRALRLEDKVEKALAAAKARAKAGA